MKPALVPEQSECNECKEGKYSDPLKTQCVACPPRRHGNNTKQVGSKEECAPCVGSSVVADIAMCSAAAAGGKFMVDIYIYIYIYIIY